MIVSVEAISFHFFNLVFVSQTGCIAILHHCNDTRSTVFGLNFSLALFPVFLPPSGWATDLVRPKRALRSRSDNIAYCYTTVWLQGAQAR